MDCPLSKFKCDVGPWKYNPLKCCKLCEWFDGIGACHCPSDMTWDRHFELLKAYEEKKNDLKISFLKFVVKVCNQTEVG